MKDYYEKKAQEYFDRTVAADSSRFLTGFLSQLNNGSSVLDLGCGSGRDLLWLKQNGMEPEGFEQSTRLAGLAGNHSGCPVTVGDFETVDFSKYMVDGILFSASLVHVPHDKIGEIIKRALTGLKQNGVIYISLKTGKGTKQDKEGRIFYLWEPSGIETVFNGLGLEIIESGESDSVLGKDDVWLGYVLKLPADR